MNPAPYNAEAVPLQMGTCNIPAQPGGPTMVQHTTVNVTTEPPKDHIIWSLCCFVYSNPFCLGLAALIFSIKSRDRKAAGDLQGAQNYGSTARQLNITATTVASIIFLIFTITIIAVSVRPSYSYGYGHRYYNG